MTHRQNWLDQVVADPRFATRLDSRMRQIVNSWRPALADAEDLRQDVIKELLSQTLDRRERDDEQVTRWLLELCSRFARRRLCSLNRKKRTVALDESVDVPDPSRRDVRKDFWEVVNRAADGVKPPPPRQFVRAWCEIWREQEDISEAQISIWRENYKRDRASIYRWHGRILKELRSRLGSMWGATS